MPAARTAVWVVCLTGADSLVHVSQDALPGDAFALSLNKVWEVIKSQKDLNLPAHKVRCHNFNVSIVQIPSCLVQSSWALSMLQRCCTGVVVLLPRQVLYIWHVNTCSQLAVSMNDVSGCMFKHSHLVIGLDLLQVYLLQAYVLSCKPHAGRSRQFF